MAFGLIICSNFYFFLRPFHSRNVSRGSGEVWRGEKREIGKGSDGDRRGMTVSMSRVNELDIRQVCKRNATNFF